MCLKMPKPKLPAILPKAPPAPEESPKAPVLPEDAATNDPTKKKGRTKLRIDINPSAGAGLRI